MCLKVDYQDGQGRIDFEKASAEIEALVRRFVYTDEQEYWAETREERIKMLEAEQYVDYVMHCM